MRLHTIKLSGFKSFAEPTTFSLPGQLVGVVGPNGCGKSNIMDAVRWVLGESKASELRGESMQDVIFNGTTQRKPASRASVELVFDNADHRAGGQWAQYAEIAVKRVLTRDGNSSYYINNQAVRRRDVQDVFLGTGLGPRAYAIIGQGTISRIIESRPEELRLFLEEAAGVSKYKERRRETSNRLNDTRENLLRVEDILRELNANLDKLEKQAEVATRYHQLQSQVTLRQQQLWWLKRRDAELELARVRQEGLQALNELEGRMAELRRTEAELEAIRQTHDDAGDLVNQAQAGLYEAGTEVARLEAEIRYVVEGRTRVLQRLDQLKEQIAQWQQRQQEAGEELEQLAEQNESAAEQAEILAAQCEEQAELLPALEDSLRRAQGQAQQQRALVTQVQQAIQVLAAEQRGIADQKRQLQQRRDRLAGDQQALAIPDESRLERLREQLEASQEQRDLAAARLDELQELQPRLEQARREAQADVNREGKWETDLSARLEALQERSLEAEARFEELDLQLADSQQRHLQLEDGAIDAERRLAQAREQLRALERQAQEAQFSERSLQARRSELQRAVETAEQQSRALADELQRARDELARLSDAAAQGGLQDAIERRLEREQVLAARRSQYDELTARLRASDEQRQQHERALDPLRARITEFQLKEQAAQLGLEQFSQSLSEAGADLEALAAGIEAEGVKLHGLQAEIDRGQREISALGAVNLAALDELSSARERKSFLDSQSADLNEAMQTLEDAIRKIDGETRELLGSTFETVNGHFSRMFPDLFGGGQARLIMTGDEILDAGVQVMAQPPGKKNQTIHLLSGGEKALTAIALVFAIFQLNPAPFCLLDEVDAPLDDANTERYAKLVARMSSETQFLFISHNKIAMEMARQLIGVTMQEQGVSRIVAVDMETAATLMETA